MYKVFKTLQKIKEEIIVTKLDLLFGLASEERTIRLFEMVKKNFEDYYTFLTDLEILQKKYYQEEENTEMVRNLRLQLYQFNNEFKNNITEYQRTGEVSLLRDTIKMYIKQISPLERRIHHFLYGEIYVDEEEGKQILRTPRLHMRQKEDEWEEGEVISNLK